MRARTQPKLLRAVRLPVPLLLLLLLPLPLAASAGVTLTYRKVFKGSSPELTEIKIREDGTGTYEIRQLDDEPDARPFEVTPQLTAKMFELSAALDHFRGVQLDVRRRIANLGQKTFRYERGAEAYETTFNYTVHPVANQLLQIFEGLARQQEHLTTLQRRMRYDRLGVHDALVRFEVDLNRKLIPEPERLLPALEAIANDPHFVEIARQRARALIERIRLAR